jgi:hypothetical protein
MGTRVKDVTEKLRDVTGPLQRLCADAANIIEKRGTNIMSLERYLATQDEKISKQKRSLELLGDQLVAREAESFQLRESNKKLTQANSELAEKVLMRTAEAAACTERYLLLEKAHKQLLQNVESGN